MHDDTLEVHFDEMLRGGMSMNSTNPASYVDDFSKWKSFLNDKVEQAHHVGMSNDAITNAAVKLGSYLTDQADPANPQERLLKQLWDNGSKQDQESLARMMINMVQHQN
jgi:hypothetical protein